MDSAREVVVVLTAARAEALAERDRRQRELAAVVAATEGANTDDEHDPEGSTIAWERQQIVAALERARARVAALDAALERDRAGGYGTCVTCGAPIAAARLEARPETPTCVACAR